MNDVTFINLHDLTLRFPGGPPIGHVRNVRRTDDGGLEFELVLPPDALATRQKFPIDSTHRVV